MAVVKSDQQDNIYTKFLAARKVSAYTIRICSNQKVFLPEFKGAVVDDLIETAKRIFIDAWEANDIRVETAQDWEDRERLERSAIRACNRLLALMQIAKTVYHLRSSRIKYWGELTRTAREDLKTWHTSDRKRYTKVVG